MKSNKKSLIILTGGGTIGSVSPLLAIYDQLKKEDGYDFFWLGTKNGPEKEIIEKEGVNFFSINSGKLRRYFSLKNFSDFFLIIFGFFQALFFLLKNRPKLILSAGGFVSVPIAYAGFFLKIPLFIHQQDLKPGLANKIMAPIAKKITVTFEKSLKDYKKYAEKIIWSGNPLREVFLNNNSAKKIFFNDKITVFIVGGGTGSLKINEIIADCLDDLLKKFNIIHITGKDKRTVYEKKEGYLALELVGALEMLSFYKEADLVISRCGMGALTEVSFLNKRALLIPLPDSHQENNAAIFKESKAAVVVKEQEISSKNFLEIIEKSFKAEIDFNALKNIIKSDQAHCKIIEAIKKL